MRLLASGTELRIEGEATGSIKLPRKEGRKDLPERGALIRRISNVLNFTPRGESLKQSFSGWLSKFSAASETRSLC